LLSNRTWNSFKTITRREISRFLRIWVQTIIPSAITLTLYFIIFGNLIGPRIGSMEGFNYMQFIAPGLIMMAVITNSYANVVSSFYGARFQRNIDEMLISPTPNLIILCAFVLGGMCRGLIVAVVVTLITLFFTHMSVHSWFITFSTAFLCALLFALAGFANAVFAKKFDDISFVPTFILTPLTYLGGVFYSIKLLPEFWQHVSQLNPVLYMVNTFRYGILGTSDINIYFSFAMILSFIVVLFVFNWWLLVRGVGIRS